MTSIIVAFPKLEDAKSIRTVLVRSGYHVDAVCTSGAQILSYAEGLRDGIVICGYRLQDMIYAEVKADLPENFQMLLLASPRMVGDTMPHQVTYLTMPLKIHELLEALEDLIRSQVRRKRKLRQLPKQRSAEEKELIDRAKALLLEKKNMNEEEAHKYIQRCSMDSGTGIVETAQMLLTLYGEDNNG